MKKKRIEKNLLMYQFDSESEGGLGINIYVLVNKDKAVMFDSGYQVHFEQVMDDLNESKIEVVKLILTHFHPDHIGGITNLRNIDIIGSSYSTETLKKFYDNYQDYEPSIYIEDTTTMKFGKNVITLSPNKGHSNCTLLISINDKYLLPGDDIMFENNGTQCLPYCAESVKQHLEAVKTIESEVVGKVLLPNHGVLVHNEDKMKIYIDNIKNYLNFTLENPYSSISDFKEKYKVNFYNEKWHQNNAEKVT